MYFPELFRTQKHYWTWLDGFSISELNWNSIRIRIQINNSKFQCWSSNSVFSFTCLRKNWVLGYSEKVSFPRKKWAKRIFIDTQFFLLRKFSFSADIHAYNNSIIRHSHQSVWCSSKLYSKIFRETQIQVLTHWT